MTNYNQFLEKFNEAFAKGDVEYIKDHVTNDIAWNMVGGFNLQGKDAFNESLKEMEGVETLEMQMDTTITNGNKAVSNGTMKIKEASGNIKSFGFCDIYEFENSKVKKMTSYVVPLETK